jgi:hypothetical protein
MKNLLSFEDFINEGYLNEALTKMKIEEFKDLFSSVTTILKDLNLSIESSQEIKYAPKSAESMISDLTEKNKSSFIISFNEDEAFRGNELPYWVITGVVSDKKGTDAVTGVGGKAGDMAYIVGCSGQKYEGGKNWTLGQLGLSAQFASGKSQALTPVKNHLWEHTQINKSKGTKNYLLTLK